MNKLLMDKTEVFLDWSSLRWLASGPSRMDGKTGKAQYRVNFKGLSLTLALGEVRPTNDGRWTWRVWSVPGWHIRVDGKVQGCCLSLAEAMEMVEKKERICGD